jgi:hypothetical protein
MVRLREKLPTGGEVTPARLLFEDWRDRYERKANLILSVDEFQNVIRRLAEQHQTAHFTFTEHELKRALPEADRHAADKAAIRKAVESYVAAFNQGDAKALAAKWAPEAVYTNPLSGEQVVGREESKAVCRHFATRKAPSWSRKPIPFASSRRMSPSNRERPR